MATNTFSVADTSVSGRLEYSANIPFLDVALYGSARTNQGVTILSNLYGATGFKFDFTLDPPANNPVVFGLTGLPPNTTNTVYAASTSGLTFANGLVLTPTNVLITDNYSRWATPPNTVSGGTGVGVIGTVLPSVINGCKFNNGNWYVFGQGGGVTPNFTTIERGIYLAPYSTNNPFTETITDLAFDTNGMGIAVGPTSPMSMLLDNKIWLPVYDSQVTRAKIVIHTDHWYAFGANKAVESYNGVTWSALTTTGYVPTNPVGVDWDSKTNTLIVAEPTGLFVKTGSSNTWGSYSTTAIGTLTNIVFNGTYWLVNGTSGLRWFTSASLTLTAIQSSPAAPLVSVTWANTRWNGLGNDGRIFTSSDPRTQAWTVSDPLRSAIDSDLGSPAVISFASGFPLGNAANAPDPAVSGVSLTNQTGTSLTETLTFNPERTSDNRFTIPYPVSYLTQDYTSFNLTFTTDQYSPKNIQFISPTETYTLKVLESANVEPLQFSSSTSQSAGVYRFVNDSTQFSDAVQYTKEYTQQIKNLTSISNFVQGVTSAALPTWFDSRLNIEEAVSTFLNGVTLYSENEFFDYDRSGVQTIEDFSNYANPVGVLGGETAYDLRKLAVDIAVNDATNFVAMRQNFKGLVGSTGTNFVGLEMYDPQFDEKLITSFNQTIIAGGTGIVTVDPRAKTQLVNAMSSIASLEYVQTTDYSKLTKLKESAPYLTAVTKLRTVNNNPTFFSGNADAVQTLLDYGKTALDSGLGYSSNTVFNVKYDGYMLSFFKDSVLINQYVTRGPLKVFLNFDGFTSLFNSQTSIPPNYMPKIMFNISPDNSTLQKSKTAIQDVYAGISYASRNAFVQNMNISALLVSQLTGPLLMNDYYFTISQFASSPNLVQYCSQQFNRVTDSYQSALAASSGVPTDYAAEYQAYTTEVISGLLADYQTSLSMGDYTSVENPYPTKIYTLNQEFAYAGLSLANEAYTPVYNINDYRRIDTLLNTLANTYVLATDVLTNYDGQFVAPTPLPTLPSKEVIKHIKNDLEDTVTSNSILDNLGGSFICNTATVFGSTSLFVDTASNNNITSFLDTVRDLGLALNNNEVYGEVFSSILDNLDVPKVINMILKQRLSNVELALQFLNSSGTTVSFPGVFDGVTHQSNQFVDVIWDKFYNFENANVVTSTGAVYSISSKNYNNNLRYITSNSQIQFPVNPATPQAQTLFTTPYGVYLPVIGINFGEQLVTTPELKDFSSHDVDFNNQLIKVISDNYASSFPKSLYTGYNEWMPLTNFFNSIPNTDFVNDLITARKFSQGTLLKQDQYLTDTLSYITHSLPIQSNFETNLETSFQNVFLPVITQAVEKAFNLVLGDTTHFIPADKDALYKKYLTQADFTSSLNAVTGPTSSTYTPSTTTYVDVNRIYSTLATYYTGVNNVLIKSLFTSVNNNLSSITDVSNVVRGIIDGTYPQLVQFNAEVARMNAQADVYTGTFATRFTNWYNYYVLYDNLLDSAKRYSTMSDALLNAPAPPIELSTGQYDDFIVSIPPYDTSRWNEVTGVTHGYSRYNAYWRYVSGDVVGFEGKLYQCINTERSFSISGIPPGGYSQNLPSLNAVVLPLGGVTGTVIRDYSTGATNMSYYNYPITGDPYTGTDYYPLSGLESLLAWEEWHDVPDPVYSQEPPEVKDKGQLYTDLEREYVLNEEIYPTAPYDPDALYFKGNQVYFNNTVYRCLGGALINTGVGKGIPPGYADSGSQWVLISGGGTEAPPGSNGVWTTSVEGVTINTSNILNPDNAQNYSPGQILPEINIQNPYVNAPVYDATVAYNIGDLVIYNGVLNVRLANASVLNQKGVRVQVVGISPASAATQQSDKTWKAYPYMDLSVEGRFLPEYSSTAVYNYGDLVVYKNVIYKYLINIVNTYGPVGVTQTNFVESYALFYETNLDGPSGATYISYGAYIPGVTLPEYSSGVTHMDGLYTAEDSLPYSYDTGVTYIPGFTLTTYSVTYQGTTGAPAFNEGAVYSTGDQVSAFGAYTFQSLVDNNTSTPPVPDISTKNNIYWAYIGSASDPTLQPLPPSTTEYSFTEDYNAKYHLDHNGPIFVTYDGGLWMWAFTRGIDYWAIDPTTTANLMPFGVVTGIPPPQPTPFNQWSLVTVVNNLNPNTNQQIYQYSPLVTYTSGDIVYYKGFYFQCNGTGFGVSVMDRTGTILPTQMYVPETEVSYGRLLNNPTKNVTYMETIINRYAANWTDTTQPKWGSGVLFDTWETNGFAGKMRKKLASGVELTYVALKHDLSVVNALSAYTVPSDVVALLGSAYTNVVSANTKIEVFSVLRPSLLRVVPSSNFTYPDLAGVLSTHFEECEFYYYSNLLTYVNSILPTIKNANNIINKCYDAWKERHNTMYYLSLSSYMLNKTLVPSVTGYPLLVKNLGIQSLPILGTVVIGTDMAGNVGRITGELKKLAATASDTNMFINEYFTRNGPSSLPAGLSLTTYANSVKGLSFDNLLDSDYIQYALSYFIQSAAFYHRTTGERYYGEGATGALNRAAGSTGIYVPPDQGSYVYLDIKTLETKIGKEIAIADLIPGWRDTRNFVSSVQKSIEYTISTNQLMTGYEMLGGFVDDGINNYENRLYRKNLLIQTGYDETIAVPIFTRKDREYLSLSLTNDWITRPYIGAPNNTFIGYKNTNNRSETQPSLPPNYLTEKRTFNAFPVIFQYNDVSDALSGISGLTGTQFASSATVVNAIRTSAYQRMTPGLTGRTNFLAATDYTVWQPWGQFGDNAGFDGFQTNGCTDCFVNSGSVSSRRPSEIYQSAGYNKPSQQLLNDATLFAQQGKHVMTTDGWHRSLIPYFQHIKLTSEIEQSCLYPENVSQTVKSLLIERQQAIYDSNKNKIIRALFIVAIVLLAVLDAILIVVTLGTAAGPLIAKTAVVVTLMTAAIGAVGIVGAILTSRGDSSGAFLSTLASDPGSLMISPITTPAGLAARCSAMQGIATLSSDDAYNSYTQVNSTASQIGAPASNSYTYYEYAYSFGYIRDILDRYMPAAIANGYQPTAFPSNSFTDSFLMLQGIEPGSTEAYEYYATQRAGSSGPTGTNNVAYTTGLEMIASAENIIANYEQQLFNPYVTSSPIVSRNAVLTVYNIIVTDPEGKKSLYLKNLTDNVAYVPPIGSSYDLLLTITDPGEGFYLLDSAGNKKVLINTLVNYQINFSGAQVVSKFDIMYKGRYLYHSGNPANTAVNSLASFTTVGNPDLISGQIPVRVLNGNIASVLNQTFQFAPPTYGPVVLTVKEFELYSKNPDTFNQNVNAKIAEQAKKITNKADLAFNRKTIIIENVTDQVKRQLLLGRQTSAFGGGNQGKAAHALAAALNRSEITDAANITGRSYNYFGDVVAEDANLHSSLRRSKPQGKAGAFAGPRKSNLEIPYDGYPKPEKVPPKADDPKPKPPGPDDGPKPPGPDDGPGPKPPGPDGPGPKRPGPVGPPPKIRIPPIADDVDDVAEIFTTPDKVSKLVRKNPFRLPKPTIPDVPPVPVSVITKGFAVLSGVGAVASIVMAGYQLKELLAEPSAAVDCSDAKARNDY